MCALFGNAACIEHDNFVRINDRRQSVCDDDGGARF